MVDLLIQTIEPLGYPVRLQGSLSEQPPPDHYFTFWNNAADGSAFYDNDETANAWSYSLNFYSVDPVKVNSMLIEAKTLLKAAGFTVTGAGHSIMSDFPTHTGRGITVHYRQQI